MQGLRIHGYALAVSFCFIIFIAASQRIHPSEGNALIKIKKSLIDPKDNLRNWNKGDPCKSNWTGVCCLNKVGNDGYFHVHELYLMTLNLSGSLAPQLGQLSHLVILLLNGNNLSGKLPDELGNLLKLDRIQVDQNQLSGPIPESFSNLVNVKHLHMTNNSFSGHIPPTLSKLRNLRHLLIDNNNLSGYLPPEFSMLQNLRIIQLDNNNFSGNGIPSTYANLSKLAKLSLRNCTLQGAVPNFSSLPKLKFLDLSWNCFTGHIPLNKLADGMTTIDLSNNYLNGTIPQSFSYLPHLQKLSLKNNNLSGSIPASMWQNITFIMSAKLLIDLRNNSLLDVLGSLNPPENVTLRLSGNPICINSNMQNIGQYCEPEEHVSVELTTNSTVVCPVQACPVDNFYEYAPSSPVPCFCAAPIRIGYRLKSPSFSYFPTYRTSFQSYITQSLNMDFYQLSIDSYSWEEGPRLNMYLKFFLSTMSHTPVCSMHVKRFHKLSRNHTSSSISIKIDGLKTFTLKELARATDKFNDTNKVGQGGYGNVYKGILSDETFVAVKRAEEGSLQGQKEFLTEIELLSRLHHRNLVSLIGYCDEAGEQMLVYEFMPNGTLRDWISGRREKKESLSFGMRLQIAKGAAKGILYLHTEANPPIFHRDIKASNILLDSNFIAKVADFGLSRLAPILDDEGHLPNYVSTVVKGTPGYLDPEYLLTRKLTDKSDVYSLGIVYLELLTGMQPISHGKNIVREVNMARQSGMIYSIVDSRMGFYQSGCLDKFLNLALSCCEDNRELRPSMVDVVRELDDIIAMFPETNDTNSFSDFTSDNSFCKLPPSSSSLASTSSNVTREDEQQQQMTWYVSGSDLVSGVVPTIAPR
ncbi:hypothetical protein TanjilG_12922 [Lupinus angustifolius]|uniref:non-specific serine/threonine protein kinase n=1 Tax=Lupinus angustifolius TaxID=3871 RepID=A0A1J7GLS7_LUPAN|nr:hypothetical protein TanjilG_12922 [Lupinus angustifolius]